MANILRFEEWLKKITIIIDTREKKNDHIVKVFNKMNIKYENKKLESCDYAFKYNYYDSNEISKCIIERKNSLDELSQNFTKNRARFKKEFEKLSEDNCIHLVIENNTLDDLIKGNYSSSINRNSFIASLLSFELRYNIKVHFISSNYTAFWIAKLFYYYYYASKKRLEYKSNDFLVYCMAEGQ
ncbi:MAG: hypothetical protein EHM20_00130 [Alphaproteobacteria bacterium]|nr:MAG: hypothetical protein EHM20_00130 [Alphaproteobacteria bacterium]